MSANAVNNENLKDLSRDSSTAGFVPDVSYAYDAEAKEVDITDNSDFPTDVAVKKVKVSVHDKFGGEVRGFILPTAGGDSGHDGTTTIDVSTLDASKGLDIKATVIADDDKLVADGIATNIGAAGSLGSWDAQKNA